MGGASRGPKATNGGRGPFREANCSNGLTNPGSHQGCRRLEFVKSSRLSIGLLSHAPESRLLSFVLSVSVSIKKNCSPRNPWPLQPVMHMPCGCGIRSLPLRACVNTAAIPGIAANGGGRKCPLIGVTSPFPKATWGCKSAAGRRQWVGAV